MRQYIVHIMLALGLSISSAQSSFAQESILTQSKKLTIVKPVQNFKQISNYKGIRRAECYLS